MGSVEGGPGCVYCAVRQATHIDYWFIGPICGVCCELAPAVQAELRVGRWRRFRFAVQKQGSFKTLLDVVGLHIGAFIVHV